MHIALRGHFIGFFQITWATGGHHIIPTATARLLSACNAIKGQVTCGQFGITIWQVNLSRRD